MKKILSLIIVLISLIVIDVNASSNPVDIHGKLSVSGINIVDSTGKPFQLRGVSTHGIAWFPEYVNQESFIYMRDNWNINAVRLAMYSDPSCGRNQNTYELVKKGVEYAKNAGLYVIIDWHILNDNNPNIYKNDAIEFFKQMTSLYKDYDNVLYEICNEPNGSTEWSRDIKPYAETVISEIRKIDDDAIIIVGTPTWSQDVDIVANDRITNYSNLVYTLHFYAGTHKDNIRDKYKKATSKNLPILVSEFGGVNADGNGSIDYDSLNKWIDLLDTNKTGYFIWQLSNKNEGSSIIRSDVKKTSGWSYDELADHGKWLVDRLKKYEVETTPTSTTTTTVTDNTNVVSTSKIEETNNNKINISLPIVIIGLIIMVLISIIIIIGLVIIKKNNSRK